jgi:hypothetical protein
VKSSLEWENVCTLPHRNSHDEKDRHLNISLPQQERFPAPLHIVFRSRYFALAVFLLGERCGFPSLGRF